MARGLDSGHDASRQVGRPVIQSNPSTTNKVVGKPREVSSPAIRAEASKQRDFFGTVLGPMDDGHRSMAMPAPAGGMLPRPTGGEQGPGHSNPAFHGAAPEDIMLAQMQVNREHAMAHLMQPPPSNDRKVERMVDPGMGRLSAGPERPVHSYVDERIKIKATRPGGEV